MVRYVWLGLIQGITEFLPISSSAHLLLARRWLGLAEPAPLLVAFAHLGTLLSLLLWFRKDLAGLVRGLWRREAEAWRYLGALGLGTAPLGVGAALVYGRLDQVFRVDWVPFLLFLNGGILLGASLRRWSARPLGPGTALGVGLAQLFALLPGLSRSGLTLSAGLGLGLGRDEAFRFSFLLGIPAILGGAALASLEGGGAVEDWAGLFWTAGTAFLAGFLSLSFLIQAIRRWALWPFGLYCLLLAGLALL